MPENRLAATGSPDSLLPFPAAILRAGPQRSHPYSGVPTRSRSPAVRPPYFSRPLKRRPRKSPVSFSVGWHFRFNRLEKRQGKFQETPGPRPFHPVYHERSCQGNWTTGFFMGAPIPVKIGIRQDRLGRLLIEDAIEPHSFWG